MVILGNDDFGKKLAEKLDARFVTLEQRVFPDGEACPRIADDINGNHAIIALRMSLPIDANRYLVETLLTIKSLKESGVKKIDVAMPYFVYARQDKAFRKGEPFSSKYILELLKEAGASRFFTVSSHADRNSDKISFSVMPSFNVNGFAAIGDYIKKLDFGSPIIIAPDKGAEEFAKTVAEQVGCNYITFEKRRDLDTGDVIMMSDVDLRGKDVIIVDDIISSGGTMLKAIEVCKGAKSVMAAVVHVVSEKAAEKIPGLVATNTINSSASKIDVTDMVAERIKKAD